MANIVVAVFESNSNLEDTVSELLVSGFSHDQLHTFSPRAAGSSAAISRENEGIGLDKHERPEDAARSFGNTLSEYDEHATYVDLLGQGHVILTVYADSEERVGRAVEVMNHHSPIDISEHQSASEGAVPKGRTDTALVPAAPAEVINSAIQERKSARRSGRIRIF